ncbi:MAG: hypothetical protein AB7F86_07890 [Bdellovibrionales bacterium]
MAILIWALLSLVGGGPSVFFTLVALALLGRLDPHLIVSIASVAALFCNWGPTFINPKWLATIGGGVSSRVFVSKVYNMKMSTLEIWAEVVALALVVGIPFFFSRFRGFFFARSGLWGLLTMNTLIILIASNSPGIFYWSIFWWMVFVIINRALIWQMSYQFLHRDEIYKRPFYWWIPLLDVGRFTGKSHAYLERFRARDERDLAIVRLKALKLAIWLFLIHLLARLMAPLLGLPGWRLPFLPDALFTKTVIGHFHQFLKGNFPSLLEVWWSLIVTFFFDLICWTIINNACVIVIRFFGFKIPRGVYRPLEARSIPEYFARRYYYYKELIFDLFVLPMFFHLGAIRSRQWRLFWAVTIGLGVGSFLTHLLVETPSLRGQDPWLVVMRFTPIIGRGLVFGIIFGLYQFGNPLKVPENRFWSWQRVVNLMGIIFFFSVAKIFTPIMSTWDPLQNVKFFFYIFGFR